MNMAVPLGLGVITQWSLLSFHLLPIFGGRMALPPTQKGRVSKGMGNTKACRYTVKMLWGKHGGWGRDCQKPSAAD